MVLVPQWQKYPMAVQRRPSSACVCQLRIFFFELRPRCLFCMSNCLSYHGLKLGWRMSMPGRCWNIAVSFSCVSGREVWQLCGLRVQKTEWWQILFQYLAGVASQLAHSTKMNELSCWKQFFSLGGLFPVLSFSNHRFAQSLPQMPCRSVLFFPTFFLLWGSYTPERCRLSLSSLNQEVICLVLLIFSPSLPTDFIEILWKSFLQCSAHQVML